MIIILGHCLHLFAHKHVKVGGNAPWAVPGICQGTPVLLKIGWDEMFGSSPELVITLAQVSRLTIFSPQTSLYTPHTEKAEICLCYLITTWVLKAHPCAFCKELWKVLCSGDRNAKWNELKKTPPNPNTGDRYTRQMTNSCRKDGSLKGLHESILRSWQMS